MRKKRGFSDQRSQKNKRPGIHAGAFAFLRLSLRERHVRILWATWHLATAMGMGISVLLFWLALPSSRPMGQSLAAVAIIGTMIVSSSLVLVATKGKHPGWAGMLCVAVLAAIGAYS